jgi:hypothetical protein
MRGRLRRYPQPFKVFIDKIDGAYPIGEQRAAALGPWLKTAVEDGRMAYRDFAKVANRIGAGMGRNVAERDSHRLHRQ